MAKVLHLVKSVGASHPWDLLSGPSFQGVDASIVLLQDAVAATVDLPFPVFVLEPDARQRGAITRYSPIDDDRLLDMILEADSVIVW